MIYRHYRLKTRRRLETLTRSMSAAASITDDDDGKKNLKLQTGTRCHRAGARSATMNAPRQRPALDPGTQRTSWQRVRPLPVPRLPLPPPPPVDDSPPGPVSPPDAEVPLLSQLSLRLSSHGDPPASGHPAARRQPPDGQRSTDVGQRRLTTSGDSSPYYFKLDPALTARQSNRHDRFYSHNPCFMCESEIR